MLLSVDMNYLTLFNCLKVSYSNREVYKLTPRQITINLDQLIKSNKTFILRSRVT